LSINRVASAQLASATFAFLGGTGATSGTTTVAITGALGTATLTIASAANQASIVSTINAATAQTGVEATAETNSIRLNSTGYGRDAYVSVQVLSGGVVNANYGSATSDGDTTNDIHSTSRQFGADAEITINGQTAGTDGLDVFYNANGISLTFTLAEDYGRGATAASTSFSVDATGGATFQLGTTSSTRQTIGIDSLATYNLGGGNGTKKISELKAGGTAELRTDPGAALESVRAALSEIAGIRGRLGGFQKFQVGSAIRSLQAAQNGLSEAASVIQDTDFAVATAALNREQVLIQSTVALLGVAGQQSAQILSLL